MALNFGLGTLKLAAAGLTLASRRYPGPALNRLPELEIVPRPIVAQLTGRREDVAAIAVFGEPVDGGLLDLLPNLRIVANYGVGYDGIDVEACAARGVPVPNTPGVVDGATADLALALILAGRRRIVEADALVRRGAWRAGSGDLLIAGEVHGSRLGIVGMGRIGTAVARRAAGFEFEIAYAKRTPLGAEAEAALGVTRMEIDELLGWADVITLHTPLTAETRHLIDARRLGLVRDGALLVNTARGAVIDEEALVAELRTGRIAAALDVFENEPQIPSGLSALPNVTLVPHLGTATAGTREAMTEMVVANILAALAGEPPPNPVPGSAGT